jgi:purine-binding chemotaxis protein CheW
LASTVSIDSPDEGVAPQLVIFRLGTRTYGIELDAVREIIPFRRATRLPGAPPYVAGLMNVRGIIVTVLDIGVRLDATAPDRSTGSVMLIEHGTKVVGAAVDEVLDVRRVSDVEIGAGGEDIAPGGAIRALGRLDGEVIVLLDIRDLISQVLA